MPTWHADYVSTWADDVADGLGPHSSCLLLSLSSSSMQRKRDQQHAMSQNPNRERLLWRGCTSCSPRSSDVQLMARHGPSRWSAASHVWTTMCHVGTCSGEGAGGYLQRAVDLLLARMEGLRWGICGSSCWWWFSGKGPRGRS